MTPKTKPVLILLSVALATLPAAVCPAEPAGSAEFTYTIDVEIVRDSSGALVGELAPDPRFPTRGAVTVTVGARELTLFVDRYGIYGRHGVKFTDGACQTRPYINTPLRIPEDAEFVAGNIYFAADPEAEPVTIRARSELEAGGQCRTFDPVAVKYKTPAATAPLKLRPPLAVSRETKSIARLPEPNWLLRWLTRSALRPDDTPRHRPSDMQSPTSDRSE
jgi:hypothetical protein